MASLPACATGPALAQERAPQAIVDGVVSTVCEKRIVLLGELPSHGEAQAFDLKARITDRLIAQCGFRAVLFEAPVYDFIGLERAWAAGAPTRETLDNAIGRFWWTRELATWRATLFEAAIKKQLVVGGLDDQISITSAYARAELPRLIAAASPEAAAAECRQAATRHLGWTYDTNHPFDEREQARLQQCARTAAEAIPRAEGQGFDSADRAMLESFARYADRQRSGSSSGRDDSMYRNLSWYLGRLPADSRVVVWTATVHAARIKGSLSEPPLGARAVEQWGDRVGAIGFTAHSGVTSRAGRPPSPIAEAPPGSLEATATRASFWALLDAPKLRALGRVSSRLFGKFSTEAWGDAFDAVVAIREEAAPTFDPWK